MDLPKRLVIVGGVAAGASCAARARRLSESAEIVLCERGPHVSFANCGLPYHVGGEIAERQKLLERASPLHYVNAGDAPMLLFQGTRDPLIPAEQAFAMATALTKAQVPGRVEILVGAEHGWGEPDLTRTMNAMYAFLQQQLVTAK